MPPTVQGPCLRAPFSPEVRWKYSNLAYTIAGMVIEEVSGLTWADYLQVNIFDPLGMGASSVDQPDPKMATGYGRRMPDGSRQVFPFVDARGMHREAQPGCLEELAAPRRGTGQDQVQRARASRRRESMRWSVRRAAKRRRTP